MRGAGGTRVDRVHGLAQEFGAAPGTQVDEGCDGGGAGAVGGSEAAADTQGAQHVDADGRFLIALVSWGRGRRDGFAGLARRAC